MKSNFRYVTLTCLVLYVAQVLVASPLHLLVSAHSQCGDDCPLKQPDLGPSFVVGCDPCKPCTDPDHHHHTPVHDHATCPVCSTFGRQVLALDTRLEPTAALKSLIASITAIRPVSFSYVRLRTRAPPVLLNAM